MKKAFIKDTFREIKKTMSRFLSILAIVAIGIAFFTGIKITCPDMKLTADHYFDEYKLMDFRLVSAIGFNKEDVDSFKKISGVKGVMPSYSLDVVANLAKGSKVVKISSLPSVGAINTNENYINRPQIIEGRLPQRSGECIIERNIANDVNLNIGTIIKLTSGKDTNLLDALITDEFTIVGITKSPQFISKDRGTSSIGNGKVSAFMMINDSDFKMTVYTDIFVTVNGLGALTAYSKEYEDQLVPIRKSLESVSKSRSEIRYNEMITKTNHPLAKADAKAKISEILSVKFHVLDRNSNAGYVDFGNAAERMDAIASVFPIIFILVAILICFTSMSRMVEEQRTYIGTVKALGYGWNFIMMKFLLYAGLASILGGIVGVIIGFTVFPTILYKGYSILYSVPSLIHIFDFGFAALAILVAVLVTTLSALIVCFEELRLSSAALMRPKAPKAGKTILLEQIGFIWRKLKFTHKVTARNLFRYKSRFFMTAFGVAGCTALLLVGFGLKDSIGSIGTKQFGEIFSYQMTINLKDNLSSQAYNDLIRDIKNSRHVSSDLPLLSKSMDIGKGIEKNCNLIVPSNSDELKDFIVLQNRVSGQALKLNNEGVILTEKLAKKIKAVVGEDIYIKSGEDQKLSVKVTGITENYLQHYMYMSPVVYEKLYLGKPTFNQINVRLRNMTSSERNALISELIKLEGVASITFSDESLKIFTDMIGSINYIVFALIISAGLLSFIVLYTLTNINISERLREIATIKVLGFYDNEVSSYVYRENLILTLIGTLIGLVGGTYLAQYIISTAEVDMVMFGRNIYVASYVYAATLTLVFAWIVNRVMLRKLRDINMVEALKTVE